MRVAIVAFNNVRYSPYIKTYSNYLDENGISYDVIFPNRNNIPEFLGENTYAVQWDKKKHKALNFIKFRSEVIRILKKNKYDFAFVLTTIPAVLLSNFLIKHYKGRYLVDIRDYTYEKIAFYYQLEYKVLKNAKVRVISSPGFKNFLPNLQYYLCHNTSYDFSKAVKTFKKQEGGHIIIGYIGSIAYAEQCKKLIDLVVKDERFSFYFYGNESSGDTVRTYIKEVDNARIKYMGSYEPAQKNGIIQGVDILFNAYGNESKLVLYALSNKLYDSFFFKKPLLTSPNTSMSEIASKYSFDIDNNTLNLNSMYDWYNNINGGEMSKYMTRVLMKYSNDMTAFKDMLKGILNLNK